MSEPVAIDVRPLTPDRFADLAALFEEGGDPKWCWCTYFRFRGRDWSNSTADGQSRRAEGAHQARSSLPASSPTGTTVPSAGSASRRARTTSGSPPRRSSPRSTTSRSGRSSASSSRAGPAARASRRPSSTRRSSTPGPTARRPSRPTRSRSRRANGSRRRTPITARSRCSNGPASRSSSVASGMPPARSARSSGSTCRRVAGRARTTSFVAVRTSSSVRVDTRFRGAGRLPTGSHVARTDLANEEAPR